MTAKVIKNSDAAKFWSSELKEMSYISFDESRQNSMKVTFWSSELKEMLAFILAQSRRGRRELIFIEEGGTRKEEREYYEG